MKSHTDTRRSLVVALALLGAGLLSGCADSHPGDTGVAWATQDAMYSASEQAQQARAMNNDNGASGLGFSNESGQWRFGQVSIDSPSERYAQAAAQVQAGRDADAEALRREWDGGAVLQDSAD